MKQVEQFVREDGYWVAVSDYLSLYRLEIDYSLTLMFADTISSSELTPYQLIIESKCFLYTNDKTWQINPDDTTTLAPVLGLLRSKIEAFNIYDNGDFAVTFVDSAKLRIPADRQYEAWQFRYKQDFVISLPGGGLSVFGLIPKA